MRLLAILMLCIVSVAYAQEKPRYTPKQALDDLMQGNQNYLKGDLTEVDQTQRREQTATYGQNPYAIILSCSDSRVPPEIIFDQTIGDLFVVRVAGNVLGPVELDSIEFSALYLGSSLIMVMGHEACGAVKAVAAGNTKDIEDVAALIKPALDQAKYSKKDPLDVAIKDNVRYVVQQLKKSKALAPLLKKGTIDVVGAYYNLTSGQVELLPHQ